MKKDKTSLKKEPEESISDKIKRLNKISKTKSLISFLEEDTKDHFQRISSGDEGIDLALGGGWPRGTIIELFGPESSGKTWLLTKLYAECCKRGLPFLHYDAENSYNPKFAAQNGVDINNLILSQDNVAEDVFAEIEEFCKTGEFAVIGIDSLAALATRQELEKGMGDLTVGSLARTMSTCLKRLMIAVSKSNTVLVFINQLREVIGGFSPHGKVPEKTPGGRTLKFMSSVRIDVRKIMPKKDDRPDMYEDKKIVGHILKVKVVKNRTAPPFGEAFCDLWYKEMPESILLIKKGLDKDVLMRKKRADGALANARNITYMEEQTLISDKSKYNEILRWLKERKVFCNFLSDMGIDNFDSFIKSGDLSKEEVDAFLVAKASEV